MKATNNHFLTNYYHDKRLKLVKEENKTFIFHDTLISDLIIHVEVLASYSEELEKLHTVKNYQLLYVEDYSKRLELCITTNEDVQFLFEFSLVEAFLLTCVKVGKSFQDIRLNEKTRGISGTPENSDLLLACLTEFQQMATHFKSYRLHMLFKRTVVANLFQTKQEQIKEIKTLYKLS